MSVSLGWCDYCDDWWDDAHWYFFGDEGGVPYPGGRCAFEYENTVSPAVREATDEMVEKYHDALVRLSQ